MLCSTDSDYSIFYVTPRKIKSSSKFNRSSSFANIGAATIFPLIVPQQTGTNSSGIIIHILVTTAVRFKPYRGSFNAKFFFLQVLTVTDNNYSSVNYLTTTVASYLDMNWDWQKSRWNVFLEWLTDFFHVNNLTGVRFLADFGKRIDIFEIYNYSSNIFLTCSIIYIQNLDIRTSCRYLFFVFTFYLPLPSIFFLSFI